MVKILLIAGHGAGDPGALGTNTNEAIETRRVVNALVSPLRNKGLDVSVYDQRKNAFAEAQAGRLNFSGTFDYVFEVHFNSFNEQAKGTEAYITTSESSDAVEQKIVSKLSKYFVNRGVKRTNFSVISIAKQLGMSSCLYEVCFIDNASDMAAYNNNFNSIIIDMANAIAEGFQLSGSATTPEMPSKPSGSDSLTAGAYYPVKDVVLSKGHLDKFGLSGNKIVAAGWHIGNYDYEYIFVMDYKTGRELARVKAPGKNRPDVARMYSTGNTTGFDVSFDAKKFKGKTVYIMARCTNDATGNTRKGSSDLRFNEWYLTIPK